MKKNVLTTGLISGVLIATWCVCSIAYCYTSNTFKGNMLLGYTAMVLALSLIYVHVKNYRDKLNGGTITFGKAFKLGLYISLIASTIYVAAWLVDYYVFIPDFMDKFSAQMLHDIKNNSTSQAEMNAQIARISQMKEAYKNPVVVILYSYLEILPVGLIVSLIVALILKKKDFGNNVAMA